VSRAATVAETGAAERPRSCRSCRRPAIAGAERCLHCGGELVSGRRPVSPFSGTARRRSVLRLCLVCLGMTRLGAVRLSALAACTALTLAAALAVRALWAAPDGNRATPPGADGPPPAAVLATAPAPATLLRVPGTGVQYSCFGRVLPGDVSTDHPPPAVIDDNPLTVWRCDGNGASLRPRQSVTVSFGRPVTLTRVGVIGYDTAGPCRFVTRLELIAGRIGYSLRLPATRYAGLQWFSVPPLRTAQVTLVVTRTVVPPGRPGGNCGRTAIAQVGFANQP